MTKGRGGRPRHPPNYIRGDSPPHFIILSLSCTFRVSSLVVLEAAVGVLGALDGLPACACSLDCGGGVLSSLLCLLSQRLFTFRLFIFLFCGGAPSLFEDSCLHLAPVLLTHCYGGITLLRYYFSVTPALLLAWWSLIIGLLSLAIAHSARHTLLGAVWIY